MVYIWTFQSMGATLSVERTERRQKMSAVGLRAFFEVTGKWGLKASEQRILLGDIPKSTFYKWKKAEGEGLSLSNDTLERISYVVGIYKALHTLFPEDRIADNWLRWPSTNPSFSGRSPLDRMLAGQVADLSYVRRYLDAQCWAGH